MPAGRKEVCDENEIIVIDAMVTDPNSGQRMAHTSSAGGWLPTCEPTRYTVCCALNLLCRSNPGRLSDARRGRSRGHELFESACVGSYGHGAPASHLIENIQICLAIDYFISSIVVHV